MEFLLEKLSESPTKSYNDFANDRLLNRYTTILLGFLISISTFGQFYSSPINCWVPAELKRYEKFINKYCWINGTYYADSKYELDVLSLTYKQENLLFYYQWVSIYLVLIAFSFYFPKAVWHFLSYYIFDYDLFNLVMPVQMPIRELPDKFYSFQYLSSIILPNGINNMAITVRLNQKYKHINSKRDFKNYSKSIYLTSDTSSFLKNLFNRLNNSTLILSYIFIKILIFGITIVIFFAMNSFMTTQTNEFFYFKLAFNHFFSGDSEINDHHSKVFPKVAVCEVRIKENDAVTTNHLYTFECVLPYNLFNEKIYLILYLWVTLLLIPISFLELFKWSKLFLFNETKSNYDFIIKHLKFCKYFDSKKDGFLLQLFIQYYIYSNGFFLIRLLESNSNYVLVSEFISYLWENFKAKNAQNDIKKLDLKHSKLNLNLNYDSIEK